jgi:hypothetical protein
MPRLFRPGESYAEFDVSSASFFLAFVLAASQTSNAPVIKYLLYFLLSAIQPIVVLSHIALINVEYPQNTMMYISQIFPIISLDVIPTDFIYERFSYIDDAARN